MTPPQQHCDHECVCEWWRGNPSREPCCPVGSKCEHDPRKSDDHKPMEELSLEQLRRVTKIEWESHKAIQTLCSVDKGDEQEILTTVGKLKSHDATIAAKAREKVLEEVYGHMNYLSINALTYKDWCSEIKKYVESLRSSTKETPQ